MRSLWVVGERISEEEGVFSLIPSSTLKNSVRVSVDSLYCSSSSRLGLAEAVWMSSSECSGDINEQHVEGKLEQLNLNTQSQSVCSLRGFSGVIDYGLDSVIIPGWFLSEVVVRAACTLTTTSLLWGVGWVG
jgi:hypothetical protein